MSCGCDSGGEHIG